MVSIRIRYITGVAIERRIFLQIARKEEPTSGLEPLTCSLRVRSHTFIVVSRSSKIRILKASWLIWGFPVFPDVRSGYRHGYCQDMRIWMLSLI